MEAPPLDGRCRFGFPAVYRTEHHSYKEVRPLYRPRFPPFDIGGFAGWLGTDEDSSDSDPTEES